MSALFERAQKTKVMITSVPVTEDELDAATWLNLSCTIKQASFTAGQKNDIDVTTLCSEETENINGLPAPSEMSLSGNFYRNPAQDTLRTAYDNDGVYGFKVVFPSGNGFLFRAEVRQHTWDSQTNGVVAATFSLRLKGKPANIDASGILSFATDLPASQTVAAGSALTMSVVVQGGTEPYTYVWKKVPQPSAGRPAQRLIRPAQYQAMRVFIPAWLLMPMALLSPLLTTPSLSVNGAPGNRR